MLESLTCALFCAVAPQVSEPTAGATTFEVHDQVRIADVRRFGVNIGPQDRFGAGQLLKNRIHNPGFEAGWFGTVMHARAGSTGREWHQEFWEEAFNNDQYGIGHPAGFWNGASFEIVDGPAAGRTGKVVDYRYESGRPVLELNSNGTVPNAYDAMFVRVEVPGLDLGTDDATAAPGVVRPGSLGQQSMKLIHTGGTRSWSYYMDSGWSWDSGKMMPVRGNWHLDFWVKGARSGDSLRVVFRRIGESTLFDDTIALTPNWQRVQRDFFVPDDADPAGPYQNGDATPALELSFDLPDSGAEAWVDDMSLRSLEDTNATVFTDTVVNALRQLRPQILRNFSTVHGNSLVNLLAPSFARRTHGFSPETRIPSLGDYSMHEFLELCRSVGADPWVLVPVVFSVQDLLHLMEYLGGPADGRHAWADLRAALGQPEPWTQVFSQIHLEYGNECWGQGYSGDPYYGSSLLNGSRFGQIADDRLSVLKLSPWYDPAQFTFILGGQAENHFQQLDIEGNCTQHDLIGLAPYFARSLVDHASEDEMFLPLWAHAREDVLPGGKVWQSKADIDGIGQGTGLAIYELNFTTTRTNEGIPAALRNDYVTGMGGALAEPLYMLHYLADLGIRHQCVFLLAQHSFALDNGERVRLFGQLRDLQATARPRPTWLGLVLSNEALRGDLLETTRSGADPSYLQGPSNDVESTLTMQYLQAFSFRDGQSFSTLLFNLDLQDEHRVNVVLPQTVQWPARVSSIAGNSLFDGNEDATDVRILRSSIPGRGGRTSLKLPPHSLTLVEWAR